MPFDPFSPLAPARIRVLVLPVGSIRKSRFEEFVHLLKETAPVQLRDLHSDERVSNTLLAPGAFWYGSMLFEFNAAGATEAHSALVPFELFREPSVILGIADAQEYVQPESSSTLTLESKQEFLNIANELRDKYPRASLHRILLFEDPGSERAVNLEDDLFLIPCASKETLDLSSMIQEISISFLVESSSYAKSIQSLPSIPSPNVPRNRNVPSQWSGDGSMTLNRPSSQINAMTRSSPVSGNKEIHRMSMPVFSSPSNNSSDPSLRMDSPVSGRPPAKTFDEMAATQLGGSTVSMDNVNPRQASLVPSRESSHDKVPVWGFGSDSLSEKHRGKGRGRVGVVLASVYLQVGRWPDAFKESVDSAKTSKSYSDHLWYAKSLETVVISMLLLLWSGMEFQIPSICNPVADLGSSAKPVSNAEQKSHFDGSVKPFADPTAKATLFGAVTNILPTLINTIMGIYTRTTTALSADIVPQVVFSECSIRFAKLLGAITLSGGVLNESCLSHLILGVPVSLSLDPSLPQVKLHPTRKDISNLLAEAFPGPMEETNLSPTNAAIILAGIASAFSSLGMQRKKAGAMKELVSALIPGLTHAKIIGAAEAGIHPSSGVAALVQAHDISSSEAEKGLEDVLNVLCQIYGIPEAQWTRSVGSEVLQETDPDDSSPTVNGHLPKELLGSFILRSFGSIQIKIEVLRACIELCEALPDYHGILHYSATLLRTAGPGIAPSAETTEILVNIPREEQIQLATRISRTVEEAKAAGLVNIEAEYWDEFLVRGLYLMDSTGPLALQPHRRADLKVPKVETQTRDPFIHNPFLEGTKTQKWPNLLAAGDDREFVISLQNPFDFTVEIEYLKLVSVQGDLGIGKTGFTLKPYRTQSFSITGNLRKSGSVAITGCIVKVQGCKSRLFPIFSEAWAPRDDVKVKDIGLLRKHDSKSRISDTSISGSNEMIDRFPQTAQIPLTVIPEQPLLIITKSSIPEDALMLLEGQQTTISLTLMNTSSTATADFIHLSYFDSVSDELQKSLSQKGIQPQDMYEIEYQLTQIPSIISEQDQPHAIAPLASETFTFKIRAKPGLTSATFQFDYASMRDPHLDSEETLFTRRAVYSLAITVNASIQIQRLEIIPAGLDYISEDKQSLAGATTQESRSKDPLDLKTVSAATIDNGYCLLLLDLRNAWPAPLSCSFRAGGDLISTSFHNELSSSMTIKPGQVVRQVLAFPKIYIANPHKRIKSMSPSRNRQFVVSTDHISPDTERSIRELFWFREALLAALEGSWTKESNGTTKIHGTIDLRSIRINSRMVEALRLPDVSLSFQADGNGLKQISKSIFQVQVDEFVTITVRVRNRSPKSMHTLLRLQPSLADQPREIGLDIGKRFAWSGVLQRALPKLMPDQEYEMELPICALCTGEFIVSASVEEIQASTDQNETDNKKADEDLDDLARPGRRSWIAGQTCRLVAHDDQ